MYLRLCQQLCGQERVDLAGCDVAEKGVVVRDPIRLGCQYLGFFSLRGFLAFGDVLDIAAPAP